MEILNKTLISFDLFSSYILEKHGSSTINIKTTEYEKSIFIVILKVIADRTKLSSIVIFKLKNIFKEIFSDGIYIRVNEKKWMNKNEML